MQSLKGGEDAMLRLDQLEALYYKLQLQLYDIQAEVLRCEELLLAAQLQSLRRQMTGEPTIWMCAEEQSQPEWKTWQIDVELWMNNEILAYSLSGTLRCGACITARLATSAFPAAFSGRGLHSSSSVTISISISISERFTKWTLHWSDTKQKLQLCKLKQFLWLHLNNCDVIPEQQDEVVYYDAFESPDAMKGEEDPATPPSPLRDEELSVLQQRTRQLEARRGRITAKKVYLKNKKVKLPAWQVFDKSSVV